MEDCSCKDNIKTVLEEIYCVWRCWIELIQLVQNDGLL